MSNSALRGAGASKTYVLDTFKKFHGITTRPVGVSNPLPTYITSTTPTVTTATNNITYYYQGTKTTVNTDKTFVLDDGSAGLYFVYFSGSTGNILATKVHPGLTATSNPIIATIYWNGTDYGLVQDERHAYDRNQEWHNWAHYSIGTRYSSGVTLTHNGGTGAGATFATTAGEIYDEDIQFAVPASSAFPTANACRLWWQTGASTYAFDSTPFAVPFKVGANNRPTYIKSSDYSVVEMTSATNRFINFFVYVTTDLHTPIYIFAESVTDTVASDNGHRDTKKARAVPFPNLSTFGLTPEIKAIYRLIVRADGVLQAIDTTQDDYRTASSLPMAAGNTATTAAGVSYSPTAPWTANTVQTALDDAQTEIAGKLDTTTAASTYVELAGDTMTGSLTAPTFISTTPTGVAPFAISSETMVENLNSDLLDDYEAHQLQGFDMPINQYEQQNTKLIDLCTNANYTTGAGTQSADGTNYKVQEPLGTGGLKILENDNTAGILYSTHNNIPALNLSVFNDGSASSSTVDYIYMVLYISDVTKVDTAEGIIISLGKDAVYSSSNRVYSTIKTGLVTGWNFIKIAKSSFNILGTGAWNDIQSIRLYWHSLENSQNAYVTFNLIQLIRKDPSTATPNPFQRNGVADFTINSGEWFVGLESGVVVCRNLSPTSTSSALSNVKPYTNFKATTTIKALVIQQAFGLTYRIDSSNYIICEIVADILYIQYNASGGGVTNVTTAMTVAINDIIRFELERNGTYIILKAYKNNSSIPVTLSAIMTLSTAVGYITIPSAIASCDNIQALSITTTEYAQNSGFAKIAKNVENKNAAWTPTVTWTTGTPEGSVAQTARYTTIGNICYGNYSYTATDGNGATALTITLPVTPKDNNAIIACAAQQKQNATWTDPLAYIDDDAATPVIAFRNLATMTDGEAVEVIVTFQYEV